MLKCFNKKNFKIITFSILFSIFFCYEFVVLLLLNNDNQINYPSITNKIFFHKNDIDFIYSFSRKSFENLSLFNISTNVFEYQNENYHYLSSRGLGYFLIGLPNLFSSDAIKNLLSLNLLFSFLNFFLVFYFTPSKNFYIKLLIASSVFLFSSMLFGSVLNPYHYYDFFLNIDLFERVERFNSYSINRMPNILINNIFIFLNFFVLKKLFDEGFKKENNKYLILFIITCFIDTIIYFINLSVLIIIYIYNFINNKFSRKQSFITLSIIISLIFLTLFHFYNFYLLNENSYRHGFSKIDQPWTGNIIYAREMIYFPICLILFFYKNNSFAKVSLIFLLNCLLIFEIARLIPNLDFLSSRITHRNFEILFGFLSFSLFYILIVKSDKNKIFWFKVSIFYILHLLYISVGGLFEIKYLLVNIFLILVITFFIYNKIIFYYLQKVFLIIPFIYLLFLNYSGAKVDIRDIKFYKNTFEIDQKNLFNWINKNLAAKDVILAFNKGLILNAEIHTKNFIYTPSITKAPMKLKTEEILDRIFDTMYLYGFTIEDIEIYLRNYKTNWELKDKNHPFDYKNFLEKDLALMNLMVFYEKVQTNYDKIEVKNFFIKKYQKYLDDKKYINMKWFTHCIITEYDKKFINKNSLISQIMQSRKPIYDTQNIKVYRCSNV
jgi:hypothetical protein